MYSVFYCGLHLAQHPSDWPTPPHAAHTTQLEEKRPDDDDAVL